MARSKQSMPGPPEPSACLLILERPVLDGDLPALRARLQALLTASDADVVVFDVRGLAADLHSIDALVRLSLDARARGRGFCVRRASPELTRVVGLCGLDRALLGGQASSRAGRPKRSKTDSTLPASTGVSGQRSKTSGE